MFWRATILLLLGLFNIALFSRMIWGPTGILEYRELKQRHGRLQEEIRALDGENLALSKEIRLMQSDNQYVEKMIRQKLHYVRNSEIVYIFDNKMANSGRSGDE